MKNSGFPAASFLMVRPACFGSNPETLENNKFQKPGDLDPKLIAQNAVKEFDRMRDKMSSFGLNVRILEEPDNSVLPDSVFPNNWFSTHQGEMILYPMFSKKRREERRPEFIESIIAAGGYRLTKDLLKNEDQNMFLEGTGSIIFDHLNGKAYCAASERSSEKLFNKLCEHLSIESVYFHTADSNGVPIYHTNVLMALGRKTAIFCTEVIEYKDREMVLESLKSDNRTVLEINGSQMRAFCGNIILCKNQDEKLYWLMSEKSLEAFDSAQIEILKQEADIIAFQIPTIEKYGGGSVRCMIAELY